MTPRSRLHHWLPSPQVPTFSGRGSRPLPGRSLRRRKNTGARTLAQTFRASSPRSSGSLALCSSWRNPGGSGGSYDPRALRALLPERRCRSRGRYEGLTRRLRLLNHFEIDVLVVVRITTEEAARLDRERYADGAAGVAGLCDLLGSLEAPGANHYGKAAALVAYSHPDPYHLPAVRPAAPSVTPQATKPLPPLARKPTASLAPGYALPARCAPASRIGGGPDGARSKAIRLWL